jgi:hypothetical protein
MLIQDGVGFKVRKNSNSPKKINEQLQNNNTKNHCP